MATGRSSAQNRNHLPLWLREAPLPPMPASRQSDLSEPFAPSLGLPELNDPGDETAPRYTAANDPPRLPQSDSLRVQLPSGATDWLRSLGIDDDDDAPAIAPSSAAPETGDPLESFDWLNVSSEDLSRDLPPEPVPDPVSKYTEGGELPSWLQSSPADAADLDDDLSVAGLPSLDDSIPSWLASESEVLGLQSTADAPTAPPGSDSLPAWLKAELAADDSSPDTADSVPSWLRDVTSDAKSPNAAKPGEESIPAWLKAEIDPADLATETATTAPDWVGARDSAPRAADAGLPAWMLDDDSAGLIPPAPSLDAAADAGLPAWMLDEDSTSPAPPLDAAADADLPSWMLDDVDPSVGSSLPDIDASLPAWMLDADDAGASSAPPLDAAADADLPSWMLDDDSAGLIPPAPPLDAAADADLPSWMLDDVTPSPPPSASPSPAAPPTGPVLPSAPSGADMPSWLLDDDQSGETPLPGTSETALPAWLRGAEADPISPARPAGTPSRRPVPPEPIIPGENTGAFLGVTDLPAWLRQPEPEPDAPLQPQPGDMSVTEVRAMNWLSNLRREQDDGNLSIPSEAQATTPTIQLALPTFSRTPAQLQAVSLLNGLLQQPYPEAAPLPQAAPPKAWERIGLERVLYVLLALVLLIGALQPNLAGEMRFRPAGATDTAAVLEQLNTLSAADTVLLAYEWDAQRISELQPLERAVRDHLIAQEVGFISVSTDPQGTILSFDLRDALQGAGYQGQGIDYILLGYRPGGELALRGLAQNFRATLRSDFTGRDASQGALANDLATGDPRLETINDLAMIVVMADQVQDVQGWMEQVVPRTDNLPVVFLLPAEIAPVVQPYLEQPNIYALVGKGDALAYDAIRQVTRSETLSAPLLDGQVAFAIFAFLMLLLLGIVLSPLFTLKKER